MSEESDDNPTILESKYVLAIIQIDGGKSIRRKWAKDDEKLVIGRDESCDVTIRDSKISREHLEITDLSDETFLVKDLDSTNGIRFQGEQVDAQKISLDQKIQFSNYLMKVTDLQWSETDEAQEPNDNPF